MSDTELRELDAWIAEHVMGWSYSNYNYHDKQTGAWVRCDLPRFTTDPAAAMLVLERCAEKAGMTIEKFHDKWLCVQTCYPATYKHSKADTLPLAICLFARELFKEKT